MTSISRQNEVAASIEIAHASAPSTRGRLTSNHGVQKRPRVVINKAKDLASQGSDPWNNTLRQVLVDEHALHDTWEPVTKVLKRSNQALRSECNKMKSGQRENEGNWQEKVEICGARRKITLSSGSGTRGTSTTAGSANTAPANSVLEGALMLLHAAKPITSDTSLRDGAGLVAGCKKGPPRGKSPGFDGRFLRYMPPTGLSELQITADLHTMGICRRRRIRMSASCRSSRM